MNHPEDDANQRPPVQNVRLVSNIQWARLAWSIGLVLFLALFVYTGSQLSTISIPLLLAAVTAYLFNPVIDLLERHRVRRPLGILLLFLFLAVSLAWGGVLLGPQISEELAMLPDKLQSLADRLFPWLQETFDIDAPETLSAALDALRGELAGLEVREVANTFTRVSQAIFGQTTTWLGLLFGLLALPIFTFFFLRDYNIIFSRLAELTPPAVRGSVVRIVREYDRVLSGFVRGQLLVAAILAVLYSIGLLLVGIPLALVVGIVSGLGNAIPYFGTLIGLLFATVMTLLDWQGIAQLLLVYLVFLVVQSLESWLITPKIVGKSVGMSPFLVIVAVLGFGELLGFFGILVAVPLAAAVKIALRETLKKYERSPLYDEAK